MKPWISSEKAQPSVRWRAIRIFGVAIFFNYLWERAQSSLYLTKERAAIPWWHCLLASLGDALLILLMFVMGWILFGHGDWFEHPGVRGYGLMVVLGLAVIIPFEWLTIYRMEWWRYTVHMPLIPGLGIGVTAIAQMLLLPPLVFRIVTMLHRRTAGDGMA